MRKHATHSEFFAVPGLPASGKKTSARKLANRLTNCSYLCLDGVQLDNSIHIEKDLRNRKGSPKTFNVNGLAHLPPATKKKRRSTFPPPIGTKNTQMTVHVQFPVMMI